MREHSSVVPILPGPSNVLGQRWGTDTRVNAEAIEEYSLILNIYE